MPVSADLLAILACPSADHAPLRLETSGSGEELVCTSCLSRFPVTDGIPVLLADEAVPGPRGLGVPATDTTAGAESDPPPGTAS
ncbi:MAG: Trm112 family protein [Actinobacteria bacterium]|nr:Trm112 family protein [Actinomycetota bacterium]